jgi:hypothetical protein
MGSCNLLVGNQESYRYTVDVLWRFSLLILLIYFAYDIFIFLLVRFCSFSLSLLLCSSPFETKTLNLFENIDFWLDVKASSGQGIAFFVLYCCRAESEIAVSQLDAACE